MTMLADIVKHRLGFGKEHLGSTLVAWVGPRTWSSEGARDSSTGSPARKLTMIVKELEYNLMSGPFHVNVFRHVCDGKSK